MGDISRLHVNSTMDESVRPASMKRQDTFGDLPATLSRIKAKALVMPCKTDLYFPVRANCEDLRPVLISSSSVASRKIMRRKFNV